MEADFNIIQFLIDKLHFNHARKWLAEDILRKAIQSGRRDVAEYMLNKVDFDISLYFEMIHLANESNQNDVKTWLLSKPMVRKVVGDLDALRRYLEFNFDRSLKTNGGKEVWRNIFGCLQESQELVALISGNMLIELELKKTHANALKDQDAQQIAFLLEFNLLDILGDEAVYEGLKFLEPFDIYGQMIADITEKKPLLKMLYAIDSGDNLEEIIVSPGFEVTAEKIIITLLDKALEKRHIKTFVTIVTNPSCLQALERRGLTGFRFLLENQHDSVMFYQYVNDLVKAGKINKVDVFGETPLMIAVSGNYFKSAGYLLSVGAFPFVENQQGISAYHLSMRSRHAKEYRQLFSRFGYAMPVSDDVDYDFYSIDTTSSKTSGIQEGHIAYTRGGKKVLLKAGEQSIFAARAGVEGVLFEQISGMFYGHFLKNSAPYTRLSRVHDQLMLASHFIPNFKSLVDLGVLNTLFINDKQVEGVFDIFATMWLLDEIDPNLGNLGWVNYPVMASEGYMRFISGLVYGLYPKKGFQIEIDVLQAPRLVKIDHTRSLTNLCRTVNITQLKPMMSASLSDIDLSIPSHLLSMIQAIDNLFSVDEAKLMKRINLVVESIEYSVSSLTNTSSLRFETCEEGIPKVLNFQLAPAKHKLEETLRSYFERNLKQLKRYSLCMKLEYCFLTEDPDLLESLLQQYPILSQMRDIEFISQQQEERSGFSFISVLPRQISYPKDIFQLIQEHDFSTEQVRSSFFNRLAAFIDGEKIDDVLGLKAKLTDIEQCPAEGNMMFSFNDEPKKCLLFSYDMDPIPAPTATHPLMLLAGGAATVIVTNPGTSLMVTGGVGVAIGLGFLTCRFAFRKFKSCCCRKKVKAD